jgi:hypothetical protein
MSNQRPDPILRVIDAAKIVSLRIETARMADRVTGAFISINRLENALGGDAVAEGLALRDALIEYDAWAERERNSQRRLLTVAEEIAYDPRVDLADSEQRIRLYAAIERAGGYLSGVMGPPPQVDDGVNACSGSNYHVPACGGGCARMEDC